MDDAAILLYDGHCGMCRRFKRWVQALDRRGRVRPVTLQAAHARGETHGLLPERFWSQFHLVLPTGEVASGADAVAPLLDLLPAARPAAWAIRRVPGARGVVGWLYGLALARHGGPAGPAGSEGPD